MEVIKIEYIKEDYREFISFLKGKVFHLTTQDAYKSILKCGMVSNNKNGNFKINISSQNSFGRHFGFVCLFDLREKHDDEVDDVLYKYNFLRPEWFKEIFPHHLEWNLSYMILSPDYYEKLIPYKRATEHHRTSGEWLQFIPHAESWIDDYIPIEWFSKTYFVQIKVPTPEYGAYTSACCELELTLQRKSR